jgi:hypothetical protein
LWFAVFVISAKIKFGNLRFYKEAIMKWVTRAHVHVDRVACPCLIKRFIDSEAEFLFVAPSMVKKIAEETGAIPFDAEGVELGHRD